MLAWSLARARLEPVIGEGGFRILFARSLHLSRTQFPWLARTPQATGDAFADLRASLEGENAERAKEASRELHARFLGLLHVLIGKALTTRLLDVDEP